MVDRIMFDKPNGLRVSKERYDVKTASPENLVLYSGMEPMIPILQSQAVFTGSGTQTFNLVNPRSESIPFVLLYSSDGVPAKPRFGDYISGLSTKRGTYFAQFFSPFNQVQIVNDQNVARTVYFTVLA